MITETGRRDEMSLTKSHPPFGLTAAMNLSVQLRSGSSSWPIAEGDKDCISKLR